MATQVSYVKFAATGRCGSYSALIQKTQTLSRTGYGTGTNYLYYFDSLTNPTSDVRDSWVGVVRQSSDVSPTAGSLIGTTDFKEQMYTRFSTIVVADCTGSAVEVTGYTYLHRILFDDGTVYASSSCTIVDGAVVSGSSIGHTFKDSSSYVYVLPSGSPYVSGRTVSIPAGTASDVDVVVTRKAKFSVAFNANGGSGSMSNQAFVSDVAQNLTANSFARPGYGFLGWKVNDTGSLYDDGASFSYTTTTPGDTVMLYAQWDRYNVTLRANYLGGTDPLATYNSNGTVTLPTPTRTGYTFNGWYTASSGGTKAHDGGETFTPTANVTYYADWTAVKGELMYDNIFSLWGWLRSLSHALQRAQSGASIRAENDWPQINSGNGQHVYSAYGASPDYYNVPVAHDTTYFFSCSISGTSKNAQVYQVQLTSSYAIIQQDGQDYKAVASGVNVSGGAKTFSGTFETAANCAYVQLFFDVHDTGATATFANLKLCKATPYGQTRTSSAPRRNFLYTDDGSTKFSDIGVSLDTPTRTGYTFVGWFKSDGGGNTGGSGTQVTADSLVKDFPPTAANGYGIPLYSKWEAGRYTVTLNQQGGEDGTTSVTATYGSAMPSITKPRRDGYTFGGYFTSTNGGGTKYYNADGSSARTWDLAVDTTILYAKWTANTYTVTFNANGGMTTTSSKRVTYASSYGTLPTPTKTASTFAGWHTEGGTQVTASTIVSTASNHTLYAHWDANKANITYSLGGGGWASGVNPPTSSSYNTATQIPAPVRSHHTFKGWKFSGFSSGAVWGKTSSPSTSITSSTVAIGDTASAPIWVKNLSVTNNAAITMTAQWERIKYTVTVENSSSRGAIRVTGSSGEGLPLSVARNTGSVALSGSFVAYAGETYTITETLALVETGPSWGPVWVYPIAMNGYAYSRKPGSVSDPAVFTATHEFGDNESATQTWTQTLRTVSVRTDSDYNPLGETLNPTISFADGSSTDVKIVAKETDGSSFMGWSSELVSPPSAYKSSSGTTLVVTSDVDVTVTTRYTRSSQAVSALVDSATAAAIPGLSVGVYASAEAGAPAVSNVGYGLSATWKLTSTLGSDYEFAGWFRAGSSSPVSTSPTYTATNIRAPLTLYAKVKAKVSFYVEVYGQGVAGVVSADGSSPFAESPHSEFYTIGQTIQIVATPSNEDSHFSGWFLGATRTGAQRISGYAATANYHVADTADLLAYFTATAEVFYVALYARDISTMQYGDLATLALATGDDVVSLSSSEYTAESGYNPVATSGAKFYRINGIRRVDASVSYGTGQAARASRVFIGAPENSGATTGRVRDPVRIADGMPFSSVIDADCSFIVDIGADSHISVTAACVTPSSGPVGGRVFVADAATVTDENPVHMVGGYEKGAVATVVAAPDNGYVFAGWYTDAAGTTRVEGAGSTYSFDVTAAVTLYAKFSRGSFALYRWEGSDVRKQLLWKSKVYALSKPANLTSVRIDSATLNPEQEAYAIARFKYETFSSPDSKATSTVDFANTDKDRRIQDQTMRRLPQLRPERYFQVCVENDAEVDAIIIGTSGEGLAT